MARDDLLRVLADVERRTHELRKRHPPDFTASARDLRAAIAFIEDELEREVLPAWAKERRYPSWDELYSELLDVAGTTVRALLAIRAEVHQ